MSSVDLLNARYSSYNVLDRIDRWDSHTKEVVRRRIGLFPSEKMLSVQEISCLAQIAKHIIYDDRNEIIAWIVHHVDEKLSTGIGEAQRASGIKPERQFVIDGIRALQHAARAKYQRDFTGLNESE